MSVCTEGFMQYIQQTEDARARLTRRDECRPETRDIPIPEPAGS